MDINDYYCNFATQTWLNLRSQKMMDGFDTAHQELAKFIDEKSYCDSSYNATKHKRSNGKTIVNDHGRRCRDITAAGLQSSVTSPATPWFNFSLSDPYYNDRQTVRIWINDTTTRARELLNKTNVYRALHHIYRDLVQYGTAAALMDEDEDSVVRFYPLIMGSYFIGASARGMIDSLAREFTMSAHQILQSFGLDVAPDEVMLALKNNTPEVRFNLVNVIAPNPSYLDKAPGVLGKRFVSIYLFNAGLSSGSENTSLRTYAATKNKILALTTYDNFPALVPRWTTFGDNTWGHGPADDALKDIKTLQSLAKKFFKAIDTMADPKLIAPDAVKNQKIDDPNVKVVYYSGPNGDQIKSLYDIRFPVADVQAVEVLLQDRISKDMFSDLFMAISNLDRREITAEEIRARIEERYRGIGPLVERLPDELLTPLLDFTFNAMVKRGLVSEPPPEIQGMPLKIEYLGLLSTAQKAQGTSNLRGFMTDIMPIAQLAQQDVLDTIDFSDAIQSAADLWNVKPTTIRDDETIASIRANRAQVAQQQAQQEQLAVQAKAAQQLGNVPMNQDNLATRILQ